MLLLLVLVAGVVGVRALVHHLTAPTCHVTVGGRTEELDPEQAGNAATMAGLSVKRGMPPRAATIAIAAGLQESKLINIRYGDRDSVGLFQQRPSQGWGTQEELLDPVYATNAFFDALEKVPNYASDDIADIAQRVQRSADGSAYRQHEPRARVIASALTGQSHAALVCSLGDVGAVTDAATVASDLRTQTGQRASTGTTSRDAGTSQTLTVEASSPATAWAVASWAVARAQRYGITDVTVGSREWTRDATAWSDGTDGTRVTIRLG